MFIILILVIIWTIYIMKCSYDRFHNIGKLDKIWRCYKNNQLQDVIIIE
jgi:hypothetical protein